MSNHRIPYANNTLDVWPTKLLYITKATYASDWHSTLHTHPFTELFFVLDGHGLFYLDDDVFPIKKGDAILVHPHSLHTEEGLRGKNLDYIVLGLDNIAFLHPKHQPKTSFRFSTQAYQEEIIHHLHAMVDELENQNIYHQRIVTSALDSLLSYVLRLTECNINQFHHDDSKKECFFVKKYIDEHYTADITLDSLSELTYMNKFYLSHSFKEAYGISPIHYLINKRISEACALLETTNHSIAHISQIVGFSSQSYFAQAIKTKLGMSPLQYRKQKK
ncbi:MAG: AraC family transcriptional regulator, partial [Erysipelotrichaceae bacterium]